METAPDLPSDRKNRDATRGDGRQADRLARALEENSRLQADKFYLASIVESSHDAIIGIDLNGIVTAWNAAAERVFGYRSDEIMDHPLAMLIPPSRRDGDAETIQRVARGETLTHYRTQRLRKDGAVLDVSLTLSPIRDASGAIIGASKIVDDVTEQMLNERLMRRLEAHRDYLADLVESSNDAIIAGTLDGRIASWNKAAERMFGFTAREVVGLSLSALSAPDGREESEEIFQQLMKTGDAVHYETDLVRKDGTPMLAAVAASLVRNREGEVRGLSAIMRDVTEERAAEERHKAVQAELIHLSRWNTMGMMASTLAHELNQPLTAAVNYVRAGRRLMDTEGADMKRIGEFLDKAVDETKLAGGIIRSLRDFIDKRETQRALEDMNHVVEEAISLSGAMASDSVVDVETDLAPSLPPIVMDKIQVEQVLLNLIRNAMDAIGDQDTKRLAVQTAPGEPGFVVISVLDNGPGIASEIAGQLFQPFITTKEKGMGVGLTICQSIIEGHGGRIWAEENKPAGTVFRFQLPVGEGQRQ
jgi:two-component system, LuxR family, sensor kinase FixL